ncbi:MAG: sigma-54-dependent Fis family transcriptional regulator [bacterium]
MIEDDPTDEARQRRERDQLARAVAELSARFDEKVEELSLVRQVGDALGSSLDLRTICGRTVDLLQAALGPESCSVMLLDPAGALVLAAARGAFDDAPATFEPAAQAPVFAPGEGIAGAAVAARAAIRLDHAPADPRFAPRPGDRSIAALLCLPLTVRDRVVGVINLSDSLEGAFEPRHERLLAIIANTVAMAVDNARLFSAVSQARERLAHENQHLRRQLDDRFAFGGLVGHSPAFRRVLQLVEKVADTTANVLVTGESGTGKELVARTLHHNSPRRDRPFVAINCAALPESLLEAELFGIERGVATGVDARPGTFERAHGGTLFLDEIGDMDPAVQAKVLRVLQERQITRVGGRQPLAVDVRLVAATHRDLPEAIAAGRFREDLYYRLKVVTVPLPPLRERREDLIPLAEHFLARFAARHGRPERRLGRDAARALIAHPWPGNVRELEHAMEQAVLLADADEIRPDDLGLARAAADGVRVELPAEVGDWHAVMDEVAALAEKALLSRALHEANGNRTHAARALGLSRRALIYKLARHGLDAG